MADDEFGFLRDVLEDEALAQAVSEADDETAVEYLILSRQKILAVALWRSRAGDDLQSSFEMVNRIEQEMDR